MGNLRGSSFLKSLRSFFLLLLDIVFSCQSSSFFNIFMLKWIFMAQFVFQVNFRIPPNKITNLSQNLYKIGARWALKAKLGPWNEQREKSPCSLAHSLCNQGFFIAFETGLCGINENL